MRRAVLLLLFLLLIGIVYAESNEIFIHGVLRNSTTNNLTDTTQNVNLKIYSPASALLYDNTQNNQHIDDGLYHIAFSGITHSWFLGNTSFVITIGSDTYSRTGFQPSPVSHAAYWANDSDFLDGQSGAYYLDDTDTWNNTADIQAVAVGGEVSGTIGAITLDNNALDDQYYELTDKVFNNSGEIFAVVNNGSFVLTISKLFNTSTEIISVFKGSENISIDNGVISFNATLTSTETDPIMSGLNGSILFNWNTTFIKNQCYDTEAELLAVLSFTNRTDADIFTVASNGSLQYNISKQVCTGNQKFSGFNGVTFTCTDDQLGGGGSGLNYWIDNGTFLSPNSSYGENIVIQGFINASNWDDVIITESQISDLSHTTDTFNLTSDINKATLALTKNLNITTVNITTSTTCKQFVNATPCFITQCGSSRIAVCS